MSLETYATRLWVPPLRARRRRARCISTPGRTASNRSRPCGRPKRPGPVGTSLYDAESEVRDPSSLEHPGALQLDRFGAQVVEQPDAVPEQDRHQVDVYLVEESRSDALLHEARADHADVLVACDRFRLLYGTFEAVRDERERRSFGNPLLWDRMGNNKDRYVQGVSATPPIGEVECPPSRHQRPCRSARLAKELGALRR